MKIRIAVHKNCKNKTNPQKVAKGWSNIVEDLNWLEGWVRAGYGWCSTHFHQRHRKSENSSGSNMIVVDIDGDTTLDAFWATDTAKACLLVLTYFALACLCCLIWYLLACLSACFRS